MFVDYIARKLLFCTSESAYLRDCQEEHPIWHWQQGEYKCINHISMYFDGINGRKTMHLFIEAFLGNYIASTRNPHCYMITIHQSINHTPCGMHVTRGDFIFLLLGTNLSLFSCPFASITLSSYDGFPAEQNGSFSYSGLDFFVCSGIIIDISVDFSWLDVFTLCKRVHSSIGRYSFYSSKLHLLCHHYFIFMPQSSGAGLTRSTTLVLNGYYLHKA